MNKIQTSLNHSFFPLPVVLVTAGKNRNSNVMTAAWASKVSMIPPHLAVAIRKSRYTHDLIVQNKSFALNLPNRDIVEEVDICGVVSGRDENKFEKCGFDKTPGPKTKAPIIEQCPVAFECELVERVNLGSHDLFVGKVLSRLADPDYLGENGRVNYDKLKPIVYLSPNYSTHGEEIGYHSFTKK